jgi:autotransporter translocation and assembly factor TamB
MSAGGLPFEPLIKRLLFTRVAKAIFVTLGFVFLSGTIFLAWAFKTGRAVEAVRQQLLTRLHDDCDLNASFSTLSLDPIETQLSLTDLELKQLDGKPLLSVQAALVSLRLLPLFYGRVQLDRVAVLGPEARVVIKDGKVQSLPRCIPVEGGGDSKVVLGIRELTIERGRFDLEIEDTRVKLSDIGVSLAESKGGGMSLALGVDDTAITLPDRNITLRRLRTLGHLEGALSRPRAIVVDQVEVEVSSIDLSGSGSVDLLGPVFDGRLSVRAPLDGLAELLPELPPASGNAVLEVQVAGTITQPRATGRLVVEAGRIDDFGFGERATADFSVDRSGLELRRLLVELGAGAGEIEVGGRLEFDETLSVRLQSTEAEVSLARVLDALGITGAWVDFSATGKGAVTGTLRPVVLEGPFDFDVKDLVVYDRAWNSPEVRDKPRTVLPPDLVMLAPVPVRARGRWHFEPNNVEFLDARVESARLSGEADARVRLGQTGGVDVKIAFGRFDFADLGPIAGLAFGGSGALEGRFGGAFGAFTADANFQLAGASIADIPLGDLAGTLRWHDLTELELPEINGIIGKSKVRARVGATIAGDVPLSISGEVTDGRLEDLLIPFRQDPKVWGEPKGRLRGTFDLIGPVRKMTGPLALDVRDLVVYGEQGEAARLVGRFEAGRLIAEHLEIDKHGGRLAGHGFLDPNSGEVALQIRSLGSRLEHLDLVRTSMPVLKGGLELAVDLRGSLLGVTGTVAVGLEGIQAGPVLLGDAHLGGPLAGATLSFAGGLDDNTLSANGQIRLVNGLPYQVTLRLDDLNLGRTAAGFSGHERWNGPAVLEARLEGGLVDWRHSSGVINVERAELDSGSFKIATAAPARFVLRSGVLETKRLTLQGPRTRLVAAGSVGADSIDLQVDGRVDLALVELTSPSVEKAGGTLTLDSAIRGAPNALNLVGTGRVEGGLLEWRGIDSRVTGLSADLTFSQSSVLIESAQARFAGGNLSATGNVLLETLSPKNISLAIQVDGVGPRLALSTVDLSAVLDGELEVSGTMDRLSTRGQLQLRRGLAKPKIDAQSLVGRRSVSAAYDPAAERLDFDIAMRTVDNFRVKNDDMELELSGEIRLTGTNERFGMLGAMTVVPGGRASLLGREYVVQNGVFEFTDRYRFSPRYDLTFDAEACAARIRINLVGTLEKVETNSNSNPEMPDADIVSCLIRGVKTRDLDQDLASAAGSALLKLSGVDQQVKRVIPVDQIDVTTEFSSQSRAYEPRVLVAKDLSLLNRPVRLEYSTGLIRTNDQRAALRVRLTPRLNLQLGWTSSEDVPYGDWGLDLKQRWEW